MERVNGERRRAADDGARQPARGRDGTINIIIQIFEPARAGAKLNLVELTQCEITFAPAFDLGRTKGTLFNPLIAVFAVRRPGGGTRDGCGPTPGGRVNSLHKHAQKLTDYDA
ncbi:hypothetical protein EVAR_48408_1 [Eumeta japonica]|uniref:Uncharacterized protein n=1 Tax=Eumeta variegata TaxID=151549 RepID=A0A4C1XU40_EUMVA|nr:hypothetical protein EVAR_48408_1 [Eumeta japonica]